MDSDFSEFIQTPRGKISPYLDFIPILSVLSMFRLFEAVRGRLIGPKTWDRIDKIFGRKMEQPVAAPRLIWVHNDGFVLICALVVCLVYNGPGMALDFGFTK